MTTQTDQAFLSFMIGSPQAFIEGARTLRDLWSGSYLVSWLTASAMRPLLDELGADCFVTPHVDPHGNHLVRAVRGRPSENALATLPSIPNKFAALVPGDRAEHLRGACLDGAQMAWKSICDAVHDVMEKELSHNFSGWDRRWSDQVDSMFEFFAVVKPIHRSLEEQWNEEWDELGALTEMLRSVKHVPAYTHFDGRVPNKCSLLGSYEQMGPADLRESRQFWETAAQRAAIRGTRLQKVDRLCAVSLVKRFAWPVAQERLGWPAERILQIFGHLPGESAKGSQLSGNVCFHDAWPIQWPRLLVDIVNNHHPNYYQGTDAPGDWESPNPVNFLAVTGGCEFEFILTTRRHDTDPALLHDAAMALQAALCDNGAGAKTAAGYGWFFPPDDQAAATTARATPSGCWTLRLETPAFLAGAAQEQADCDLRSATLRGQLRAWWRMLHAGFISVAQLRQLEAAVWGDTDQGSAIRFQVVTEQQPTVRKHEHPGDRKSGVRYLAYGMDETSHGEPKQRWVADGGGRWRLICHVRSTHCVGPNNTQTKRDRSTKQNVDKNGRQTILAPVVDQQFQAALWLLTHFGGIGSKGRKGFGSLRVDGDLAIQSLEQALAAGATLRSQLGLGNDFDASLAESPALAHPGVCIGEYSVAVGSGRQAIEIAGRAYAEVAAAFKHDPDKIALGLPRKIHGPTNQPLRHQNAANHRRPEFLTTTKQAQGKPQDARYAAPVHLHVSEMSPGKWVVRLLALPVKYLPDAMSQAGTASFLAEFVSRFGQVIKATRQPASPRPDGPPPPPPRPIQGFDQVEVKILDVKQVGNKHQLKVQEAGKPKPGMLVDGTPPDQLPDIGATVTVYRSTTSDINSPRYRWTPPEASGRDKKRLRR